HPNGLMSKTNRRRLRRQQAGATASQGGPDFMSPEDQFRMSLDIWVHGGNLHQCRHYSLYLALQLKARLAGLETPVHGLAPSHHRT
ncbi:hypothetical protein VB737_00785, partial [Synechococcus sp. BA-120 BA3]|nr:hypothetical protein [Synechococcus sp. BA-120 BA3]